MAALYRSGEGTCVPHLHSSRAFSETQKYETNSSPELELSLDLTGAKLLSRQDLQSLAGHSILFEHTLAYVALPNIRLHGSVGDGSVSASFNPPSAAKHWCS